MRFVRETDVPLVVENFDTDFCSSPAPNSLALSTSAMKDVSDVLAESHLDWAHDAVQGLVSSRLPTSGLQHMPIWWTCPLNPTWSVPSRHLRSRQSTRSYCRRKLSPLSLRQARRHHSIGRHRCPRSRLRIRDRQPPRTRNRHSGRENQICQRAVGAEVVVRLEGTDDRERLWIEADRTFIHRVEVSATSESVSLTDDPPRWDQSPDCRLQ